MERLRPVILIAQPHLAPLLPILAMQYDVMGLWEEAGRARLAEAEILVTAGEFRLDPAMLAAMGRLRLIACFTVGYDGVDLDWARANGIAVSHAGDANAEDVADHAIGLILAHRRQIVSGDRALRAGGGICTVVFSRPERNPCIGLLMATALRHAGLPARNPHQPGGLLSLGQPGLCDQLVQSAGFRQVATTALDAPFRLPTARHYLDFVRASASPIQQILGRLEPEAAEAAWADMEERLGQFNTPGGWVGPNELLLTAAQR